MWQVVEELVQYLKEELDAAKTTTTMMHILDALEQHYISLEMLEKTRIGVSLSRLQRRAESGMEETSTACVIGRILPHPNAGVLGVMQ